MLIMMVFLVTIPTAYAEEAKENKPDDTKTEKVGEAKEEKKPEVKEEDDPTLELLIKLGIDPDDLPIRIGPAGGPPSGSQREFIQLYEKSPEYVKNELINNLKILGIESGMCQGQSYEIFILPPYQKTLIVNADPKVLELIKKLIESIDPPEWNYDMVPLDYIEVKEALRLLADLGYRVVDISDTRTGIITARDVSTKYPILYAPPGVSVESLIMSTNYEGKASQEEDISQQFRTLELDKPVATSNIHGIIIKYPSEVCINEFNNIIHTIDTPARQILIEAQVIEIKFDNYKDIGLDSISAVSDLFTADTKILFPGESNDEEEHSSNISFDDMKKREGSFAANIQGLIDDGQAKVKAKPKVTTVDGRQAIITIARQLPIEKQTINGDTISTSINYVPVGITLNIKPRISGKGQNTEIQMEVDAVVSNIEITNQVISQLKLPAPALTTREVHDIVRIPNHQSFILGGLINEEIEIRRSSIPLLSEIPILGDYLFSRKRETHVHVETIIVITPHVQDEGAFGSLAFKPASSEHYDQLFSELLPSIYTIRLADIEGLNLSTQNPLPGTDDPVQLTLENIVDSLKLVEDIDILKNKYYHSISDNQTSQEGAKEFLIKYIRITNNIDVADLVPGRQIIIPGAKLPYMVFETARVINEFVNIDTFTKSFK